ncbi:hypothetical protein GCM10023205_52980 [Yinghuangia aomiensis]|uniref:Transposase n=1 Tax=Yinghuangia aomiensis TaxID=676205 RepID=A0ABP9HUD9_9ACTN
MTDVLSEPLQDSPVEAPLEDAVNGRLIDELLGRARAQGLDLVGEGGLQELT